MSSYSSYYNNLIYFRKNKNINSLKFFIENSHVNELIWYYYENNDINSLIYIFDYYKHIEKYLIKFIRDKRYDTIVIKLLQHYKNKDIFTIHYKNDKIFKNICTQSSLDVLKFIACNYIIDNYENVNESFIWACKYQNLSFIDFLIKNYINIDIHYKDEYPIKIAAERGNLELIKYLLNLDNTINIHIDDEYVFTYAFNGYHYDILNYLLNKYNDININNDIVNKLYEYPIDKLVIPILNYNNKSNIDINKLFYNICKIDCLETFIYITTKYTYLVNDSNILKLVCLRGKHILNYYVNTKDKGFVKNNHVEILKCLLENFNIVGLKYILNILLPNINDNEYIDIVNLFIYELIINKKNTVYNDIIYIYTVYILKLLFIKYSNSKYLKFNYYYYDHIFTYLKTNDIDNINFFIKYNNHEKRYNIL